MLFYKFRRLGGPQMYFAPRIIGIWGLGLVLRLCIKNTSIKTFSMLWRLNLSGRQWSPLMWLVESRNIQVSVEQHHPLYLQQWKHKPPCTWQWVALMNFLSCCYCCFYFDNAAICWAKGETAWSFLRGRTCCITVFGRLILLL